jgi:hypothetical protein
LGQVQTVKRGGSRFYVDPERPLVTVPGVTSVISMLPKPFLQYWTAKMAAELAVDSLPIIASMAERDRQGAVDYIKGAATRYTKTRANIGSDAHDMFERMIRGEYIGRVHPDMEPYRRGFAEFLAAVNPELISAEEVAWSDTHQYAGSYDAVLRVWLMPDNTPDPTRKRGEPVDLMVDYKTSKATYPEVALQLAAYASADRMITADGSSHPMPDVQGAAVFHITPEGWEFKPIVIGEEVFRFFVALRLIFDWDREASKSVIGKSIAQSEASGIVTGTQRRAR